MQLSYLFFSESFSHSQTLSFLVRRNNKCVFGIIYFIGLFYLKNNLDNNMVLSYFIHLPKKIKLVYKIYQTEVKLKYDSILYQSKKKKKICVQAFRAEASKSACLFQMYIVLVV